MSLLDTNSDTWMHVRVVYLRIRVGCLKNCFRWQNLRRMYHWIKNANFQIALHTSSWYVSILSTERQNRGINRLVHISNYMVNCDKYVLTDFLFCIKWYTAYSSWNLFDVSCHEINASSLNRISWTLFRMSVFIIFFFQAKLKRIENWNWHKLRFKNGTQCTSYRQHQQGGLLKSSTQDELEDVICRSYIDYCHVGSEDSQRVSLYWFRNFDP